MATSELVHVTGPDPDAPQDGSKIEDTVMAFSVPVTLSELSKRFEVKENRIRGLLDSQKVIHSATGDAFTTVKPGAYTLRLKAADRVGTINTGSPVQVSDKTKSPLWEESFDADNASVVVRPFPETIVNPLSVDILICHGGGSDREIVRPSPQSSKRKD